MRAARALAWVAAVSLGTWAVAALVLLPGWPALARGCAVGVFALATVAAWRFGRSWRPLVVLAPGLAVLALWSTVRAADTRAWASGQERTPRVAIEGDSVTVENVRNALWRTTSEADIHWETRRYALSALRSVDLIVEPFDDWRGMAHIFVSFGFSGGEHVAVSIEARREAGESYSPVRGAFRHYELLYVVGDERDLIALRANIRRDPVYVFPTRATPDQGRALFVAMLKRADALRDRPEFYNTATSTCATGLLRHVNEVREDDVSTLDWRILFPGYADELAWDLGLIACDGSLDEARSRFLINARSALDPQVDGPTWSRQIRTIAPP